MLLSVIVNLLLTPAAHILSIAALFGCKCSSCMVVKRKAAVKLQKLLSAHTCTYCCSTVAVHFFHTGLSPYGPAL